METKTYKLNAEYLFPKELDKNEEYLLQKELVEKVARLLLPVLVAYLTELTNAQSDFLGISAAELFMP